MFIANGYIADFAIRITTAVKHWLDTTTARMQQLQRYVWYARPLAYQPELPHCCVSGEKINIGKLHLVHAIARTPK